MNSGNREKKSFLKIIIIIAIPVAIVLAAYYIVIPKAISRVITEGSDIIPAKYNRSISKIRNKRAAVDKLLSASNISKNDIARCLDNASSSDIKNFLTAVKTTDIKSVKQLNSMIEESFSLDEYNLGQVKNIIKQKIKISDINRLKAELNNIDIDSAKTGLAIPVIKNTITEMLESENGEE